VRTSETSVNFYEDNRRSTPEVSHLQFIRSYAWVQDPKASLHAVGL
jgi:hypothetical protein